MSGAVGLLVFVSVDISLDFSPVYARQFFRAPSDEGLVAPDIRMPRGPSKRKRVRK